VPPADVPSILPLEFEAVRYEIRGARLLGELSFRLEAGPCSVLLGPNGAGKSLTLRLADGLLAPSAGRVRWLGPGAARAAASRALVFQRPVLLRRSTAANVDYALRLRGVPRPERALRTERVLAATGLLDLAERPARRLSGGEQQRLALARAWALTPQVLFLDEPATALDPAASRALEDAVRAIRAEGTKIVMTTHDLGQAERMADEILFLHRGRLVERAPAALFFTEPRSAEAKAFLRRETLP
jgi:tungstate transport system ATP-binding protein